MIKNYFKTAYRNLLRNKSYAFINTLGLAVGIGACLLIFLVVQFESSFDAFHTKKESIYRIGSEFHNQDGVSYTDGVAFPVAKSLRLDFPQIKQVASIYRDGGQITIQNGTSQQKKLNEENFYYAEPELFDILDFPFLSGDAKTALKDPNNVVLTQATAEKYFGSWRAALGKSIKYANKDLYAVTGILQNIPPNSDFPLQVVVPYTAMMHTNIKNNTDDWESTFGGAYTFVVLPPELPVESFNAQLKAFAKKHKPAPYSQESFIAQPLTEIHFDDRFGNYKRHTFSHSLIHALSLIGLFLMVIACVNFINLATAQAVNRSKEVGVRKVLGSRRNQLAAQFLTEAALIVMTATVIAIVIAAVALPYLNRLLEVQMSMLFFNNATFIRFLLFLVIAVTFLSGIYPAIILSGFNPITALKSKVTANIAGGISLRRALVILQFAIAHILIIGMLIVVGRSNYFKNASLGFSKAAIVNVPLPNDSLNLTKMEYLRNRLLSNPNIKHVSFSFWEPIVQRQLEQRLQF